MRRLMIGLALVAMMMPAAALGASEASQFRVVVHESNPAGSLSAKQVSDLFLKKLKRWEDGRAVEPVDLHQNSRTRNAFTEIVHGRSLEAVNWYWRRVAFGGGNSMPLELVSDEDVLRWVGSRKGGVGYVSSAISLQGHAVKVLEVVDDE